MNPDLAAYIALGLVLLVFAFILYCCIRVSGDISQHEEDTKGWRRS